MKKLYFLLIIVLTCGAAYSQNVMSFSKESSPVNKVETGSVYDFKVIVSTGVAGFYSKNNPKYTLSKDFFYLSAVGRMRINDNLIFEAGGELFDATAEERTTPVNLTYSAQFRLDLFNKRISLFTGPGVFLSFLNNKDADIIAGLSYELKTEYNLSRNHSIGFGVKAEGFYPGKKIFVLPHMNYSLDF